MKNKINRFLIISLSCVLILCFGVFIFLAFFIKQSNDGAINEIGSVYMEGVSQQISKHYETTMDLRFEQIDEIVGRVIKNGVATHNEVHDDLEKEGKEKNFIYLAVYGKKGNIEKIYGDDVSINVPEPFINSLTNKNKKVALGSSTADDGVKQKMVILGLPLEDSVHLIMENGEEAMAVMAGISPDYVNEVLALEANDMMMYSHIILTNGDYVIRNIEEYRNNYFLRMEEVFEEYKGKSASHYIAELKNAISKDENYSTVVVMEGKHCHLFCTSLPNSEWYLVTVIQYGKLNNIVQDLSTLWMVSIFSGCAIILILILSILAAYYKISRRQMRELEMAQVEAIRANKSKSEFLSNMSHDIRTPMNAIVGMTAIATANITNTQQVQNCLKKISVSSKHLLGLINDVLDMSKIESGKMTLNMDSISLREVMESIVSIVQPQVKAKKQIFDVLIKDIEVENVFCDSVRLNQVLLNFLSNAIKFTPDGGRIQLSLYEEDSPLGSSHIRVHIHVKDNGIGMTPEFKEKIFDSFTREDNNRVRKTEGTGLGMAITKYIIDAMGGIIEVESEPGKGSEFHVILDLEKATVSEEEMILPSWKMLVVDDDEALCQSVIVSLNEIGINADWTLDGETAVKIVDEHHKKHEDYDIVLLDWKLPGIDGIETARQIRSKLGEEIPILLISAYDWSDIEEEAKAASINGFISKPLFKSTLYYGLKQFTSENDANEEAENPSTFSLNGRRILLAEDNELNCEVARDLLSPLGLVLDIVENGQICVDKFTHSEEGYYDAILMDLRMPVMNGYEATRAIRAMSRTDANIPIIAMTADAFTEDAQKCLECGMNAHIAKPIDTKEVVRLLEKFIKV